MGTFNLVNAFIAVGITIAIIFLYTLILSLAYKHLKKITKILLGIAVIGGMAVYYYGYATVNTITGDPLSPIATQHPAIMNLVTVLRAGISTAKMLVQIPDIAGIALLQRTNIWFISAFILVHAASLLLFIIVAISLFGKNLNRFLRLIIFSPKKIYIFFDRSNASLCLANSISEANHGSLILFIGANINEETQCNNYLYITESLNKFLNVSGMKYILRNKECHLLFLSDDEDRNATDSLNVMEQIAQLNQEDPCKILLHKKFYIRLLSRELYKMFEERTNAICSGIEYFIVNDPGLIALQMVSGRFNPAHDIEKDTVKAVATSGFEVMVLGFGPYGKAALSTLIEYGQFVGSEFKATVIDKNIDENIDRYFVQNPGVKANYNITPVQLTAGTGAFFEKLPGLCLTVNRIIIALGDDNLNISTAIDIQTKLRDSGIDKDIKIFAIVKGIHNLAKDKEFRCYPNIHIIGQYDTIFTYKMIIREKISFQAKSIHKYYNEETKNTKAAEWNDLQYIKRESNISAALHIETKLIMAGTSIEEIRKLSIEDFRRKLEEARHNLSQSEHLRWMAFYFVRGWQVLNLKDGDPIIDQDHILCRHVCLVPCEKLEEIEKKLNKKYRENDMRNVDYIYKLIHADIVK